MSYDIVPIFGALISRKMLTIHDLRNTYTYEDVLLIYDVVSVDGYNQKIIDRNQEAK